MRGGDRTQFEIVHHRWGLRAEADRVHIGGQMGQGGAEPVHPDCCGAGFTGGLPMVGGPADLTHQCGHVTSCRCNSIGIAQISGGHSFEGVVFEIFSELIRCQSRAQTTTTQMPARNCNACGDEHQFGPRTSDCQIQPVVFEGEGRHH